MVAEQQQGEDTEDADEDSMWYASDAKHSWHPDTPSSSNSQQHEPAFQEQHWSQQQQHEGPAGLEQQQSEQEQQQAGQELLMRLAEAAQRQQQQQQQGEARSDNSAPADSKGDYFDDSYFGMPTDPSAQPQDMQELQAVVSRNLQALLPKDTTWAAGSYPPRFNEVLSPVGPGLNGPGLNGPGLNGPGLDGPDPEFDLDGLDPGFDYVPDFDFDNEPDFDFDPDLESDFVFMDELYDFDVEP
jgi:hypothetical protein